MGTSSLNTGPATDHTLLNRYGYYIYIETSTSKTNQTARLTSPVMTSTNVRCLSFWYHMYGASINQLRIRLVQVPFYFVS